MSGQTSVLMYFMHAGLVVKCVMLLLMTVSIVSWTLIFQRAWFFKRLQQLSARFNQRFWDSGDLSRLFNDIHNNPSEKQGTAAIFYTGFQEFLRARKKGNIAIEPIQRIMQISYAKEAQKLEEHLPFLASVGSISPYVGLFGTVWGIMISLQALGQAQQATIAMVAPGISEALVATALGLFTAIPAVIAYNRYTAKVNTLLEQYDVFQDEFISLIEQQDGEADRG